MDITLPTNFALGDAPEILDAARPVLELPPDARLHVENVTHTARGTQIDFSYTTSVKLDDDTLKDADGVCVDVSSHGDLKFDANGDLVSHDVEPADTSQLRAISDHLSKMIANGQVYVAQPGEQVDFEQLRARGQSWVLEQDADGKKHLRRIWIA